MTTVLYIHRSLSIFAQMQQLRLAGMYREAKRYGWRLHEIDLDASADLKKMLAFWRPVGCLVEGGLACIGNFMPGDFAPVPVVYLDAERRLFSDDIDEVRHDSDATVRAAVAELLSLDLPQYAFAGYYISRDWSHRRAEVFSAAIRGAGRECRVFDPAGGGAQDSGILGILKRLRSFVTSLPRPCGILAANDEMGMFVLEIARDCGIDVPGELSVLGIDNDELRCENIEPTLSSIQPDFELSGELAARLLARRIADPGAVPRTETYSPARVVRRHSTRLLKSHDPAVARGIERIRLGLAAGIRVPDVAATMGLPLRTAQKRFLAVVGHTIDDEIRASRLARARELLAASDLSLADIAEECGYQDERALRYLLVRETGLSPRQFRKGARSKG